VKELLIRYTEPEGAFEIVQNTLIVKPDGYKCDRDSNRKRQGGFQAYPYKNGYDCPDQDKHQIRKPP